MQHIPNCNPPRLPFYQSSFCLEEIQSKLFSSVCPDSNYNEQTCLKFCIDVIAFRPIFRFEFVCRPEKCNVDFSETD